jgi:hypothetical protein
MKKTIKVIDEERGIIQCTSLDERWYSVPSKDPNTGLPTYEYYPSSSWIAGYYHKGKGFENYLKQHGEDADMILIEAGLRGSHVHQAVEMIIAGEVIESDTPIFNGQTGKEEELTTDEWEVIKTFVDWNNEMKPTYLLSERTVISKKYKYGGTLDAVVKIGEKTYLIDFKTSKAIYPSHRIQLASYKEALMEEKPKADGINLAILQIGYRLNKKGWKFTEIEDKFDLFLNTYAIWKEENPNSKPRQIDLPIKLGISNPLVIKKVETPEPKIDPGEPQLVADPIDDTRPKKTAQKSKSEAKQPNKLTKPHATKGI